MTTGTGMRSADIAHAVNGPAHEQTRMELNVLAGDTYLLCAMRAPSLLGQAEYARKASGHYLSAVTEGGINAGMLASKLRAASQLERDVLHIIEQQLRVRETSAVIAQFVLASPNSKRAKELLAKLQSGEHASDVTISDLIKQPDFEYETGQIVGLTVNVEESLEAASQYATQISNVRQHGYIEPIEVYTGFLQTLNETLKHLNTLVPLYTEFCEKEPTAAQKLTEKLGKVPSDFAQLRDNVITLAGRFQR